MLTDKQEFFFKLIESYYKETNILPNLNTLKKISNYKSYNTIYKYLSQLESKKYLTFDPLKREVIYLKGSCEKNNIYKIPFINKEEYIHVENRKLNPSMNYVAFKVSDNSLKSNGIIYQDILIIEKNTKYLNNKFILININEEYKVFQYRKKDGFIHLLNDRKVYPIIGLNNIIGKVILLIREIN